MKEPTNKIKILKTLLESPKTTGNIAIALGYKDDKGHGKYNNVTPDLKTLSQKKIIHTIESKKTVGAPGTTYDINYDISVLRELLKKYPSIVPDLQKNDKILDMLQDNHPEFRGLDIELFSPEMLRDVFKNNPIINPFIKAQNEAAKGDFKKYLGESPTFFKMCLLNDSEHLTDKAQGAVSYTHLTL